MTENKPCPLCLTPSEYIMTDRDAYRIKCPRCATFEITRSAEVTLRNRKYDESYLFSGLTRNYYEALFEPFVIDSYMLPGEENFSSVVISRAPKTIAEKEALILRFLEKKISYPGNTYSFQTENDYPIAFCRDNRELEAYLNYMNQTGFIDYDPDKYHNTEATLTLDGWKKLESMNVELAYPPQAFVAMSFAEELKGVFEECIEPLGGSQNTGYLMRRIDGKEFIGDVVDEIMAEIRRCHFIIADCTIPNLGVFFEAGFATGLGIPVIWTCEKKAFNEHHAHFDTNHFNHILWESQEDLKEKLKNRILATLGHA